jgi:hypothetical protein
LHRTTRVAEIDTIIHIARIIAIHECNLILMPTAYITRVIGVVGVHGNCATVSQLIDVRFSPHRLAAMNEELRMQRTCAPSI